ncbi:MAG: nitrogen regulation protein NR(I), partial [Alphaproteobacteria bacterium]
GGDIALLAHYFLDAAVLDGLPRRTLSEDALLALAAHDWPGNVRELENLIRRLAVLGRDEVIDAGGINTAIGGRRPDPTTVPTGIADAVRDLVARIARERPAAFDDGSLYDRVIAEVERPLIELMLARHGHNQLRAARALGLNRNTLRKRLSQLGIGIGVNRP